MDVRLPLTSAGICLALLLSGCSPSDEKRQLSLEEKTAQFEKSLDAIQDPKLKDAVSELGGSLLLLERAQLKLDSKPVETEYGEDALAMLKHYPTPAGSGRYLHQRVVRAAKRLQLRLPDRSAASVPLQLSAFLPRFCFPTAWNGSRSR